MDISIGQDKGTDTMAAFPKVLDESDDYRLELEFFGKRHGGWWLTLIHKPSGMAQIITHAKADFFKGVKIDLAKKMMHRIEPQQVYKENAFARLL